MYFCRCLPQIDGYYKLYFWFEWIFDSSIFAVFDERSREFRCFGDIISSYELFDTSLFETASQYSNLKSQCTISIVSLVFLVSLNILLESTQIHFILFNFMQTDSTCVFWTILVHFHNFQFHSTLIILDTTITLYHRSLVLMVKSCISLLEIPFDISFTQAFCNWYWELLFNMLSTQIWWQNNIFYSLRT